MGTYQNFIDGKINEAETYFYGDYYNQFFNIMLLMKLPSYAEKVKAGKEKLVKRPFLKYFEKYPKFEEQDLSPEVLDMVKSIDVIVEGLNKICLHDDQSNDVGVIGTLCQLVLSTKRDIDKTEVIPQFKGFPHDVEDYYKPLIKFR